MNLSAENIACRKALADEIIALRALELRAGKPIDSARFQEDNLDSTLHFGAWHQNLLIGCLTLIYSPEPGTDGHPIPSWQLRGMATASDWKRCGVGRTLLLFAETTLGHLAETGWKKSNHVHPDYSSIIRVWCNARLAAVPFYKNSGYRIVSGLFHIERIGPHYKMEKILDVRNG